MNNSDADRRSPMGLFPGQLAPRLALRRPQGLGGLAASACLPAYGRQAAGRVSSLLAQAS